MVRKKKLAKKKKAKEKKTTSNNAETEVAKDFKTPSVALPPHTIEKGTNNTVVNSIPWEVNSYYITSVLDHLERQVKWGPSQHFPLIIHSIRSCLNDKYFTVAREFNYTNELINKTRPFLAVNSPEIQSYYDNKIKKLFFHLIQHPQFSDILKIPGMEFIMFEMKLISQPALSAEHVTELDCQDFINKTMFHVGLLVYLGCRRLIESKTKFAKRAVARLVELNSCPLTRFSTAYRLAECGAEFYRHDEFLKHVHSTDCVGGLFMDIAENPCLTEVSIGLLYNLNDECWYKASIQSLSQAFEYVFNPWLSGYFGPTNFKFEHDPTLDEDLEGLFWLLTSAELFFTFVEKSEDNSECMSKLKQLCLDCAEKEFIAEKREFIYKGMGKWKRDNNTDKTLHEILEGDRELTKSQDERAAILD